MLPAWLLNYPVLQAADILLYRAELVPVGEDQVQHLELSREISRKWNARFDPQPATAAGSEPSPGFFPEPKPLLTPTRRVMGLDGQAKMSKSLGNTIELLEDPAAIWEKLRPAATDPKRVRRTDPGTPEVCNIYHLHKAFSPPGYRRARRGAMQNRRLGLPRLQEGAARIDGEELASISRAPKIAANPRNAKDLAAGAEHAPPKPEDDAEVKTKWGSPNRAAC